MRTAEDWMHDLGIEKYLGEYEVPHSLVSEKEIIEIQLDAMRCAMSHPVSITNIITKLEIKKNSL